jgi:hypothetical protein
MDVYWIKANIDGKGRWYLAVDRGDEICFPEVDFSEEMSLEVYREEFPDNEVVGPLERPVDVSTCRIEDVGNLEIPVSGGVVKGELSVKPPRPCGWQLQEEPDQECRWAGSSERFNPIATFKNEYGTKLQVTNDDRELVLLLSTPDHTAYKMTKWWPRDVIIGLASGALGSFLKNTGRGSNV